MVRQRKLCKRMIVPYQAHWRGIADLAYDLDARTSLSNSEAITSENLSVALRVEFGKTLGEFKFALGEIGFLPGQI